MFPVRYGQTYRVELSLKKKTTMDNVQNCGSFICIRRWSLFPCLHFSASRTLVRSCTLVAIFPLRILLGYVLIRNNPASHAFTVATCSLPNLFFEQFSSRSHLLGDFLSFILSSVFLAVLLVPFFLTQAISALSLTLAVEYSWNVLRAWNRDHRERSDRMMETV
jgi:hypothetical protein